MSRMYESIQDEYYDLLQKIRLENEGEGGLSFFAKAILLTAEQSAENRPSLTLKGTMINKPQFESLNQMAEATAAGLSQACASSTFELFQDKSFRRLAGFEQLSQVEQDRIFNELVVA